MQTSTTLRSYTTPTVTGPDKMPLQYLSDRNHCQTSNMCIKTTFSTETYKETRLYDPNVESRAANITTPICGFITILHFYQEGDRDRCAAHLSVLIFASRPYLHSADVDLCILLDLKQHSTLTVTRSDNYHAKQNEKCVSN